jgi:hypothetical protein
MTLQTRVYMRTSGHFGTTLHYIALRFSMKMFVPIARRCIYCHWATTRQPDYMLSSYFHRLGRIPFPLSSPSCQEKERANPIHSRNKSHYQIYLLYILLNTRGQAVTVTVCCVITDIPLNTGTFIYATERLLLSVSSKAKQRKGSVFTQDTSRPCVWLTIHIIYLLRFKLNYAKCVKDYKLI